MGHITWNDLDTGNKAQFIADIMKTSLFDYAFDSNKVPSLNLHHFCRDYIRTFSLVEDGVMREGNLIPLVEEFECIINKSIWLPKGISRTMLFYKNKNGKFVNASTEKSLEAKTRSEFYLENAKYIQGVLEADNDYLYLLIEEINDLLRNSSFSLEDKRKVFFCTREFLSELINIGVNKTHLYNLVQKHLFINLRPDNDLDYIMSFLRSLLPVRNEYETVFGITEEVYFELKDVLTGLREATNEEATVVSAKYVAENKFWAYDPVSALRIAKSSFSKVLSVYNACKHDTNIRVTPKGRVRLASEEDFHTINESKGLLSKNRNKNRREREEWLRTAIERPISNSLVSAFELHNTALEIDDPQTQLLNLWTIFELLIETKQDFMNRINYISNILCSILCNFYYERKIDTLLEQIKRTNGIISIIEQEPRGTSHTQKFALILKSNDPLRQQIIGLLNGFPLEVYMIEELASLFASRKALKEDLERHSERLRWQIMRIYRNRCMIIHNGESFSQLSSVLENEHYYVDELFNYVFLKREKGVLDADAIFTLSRVKEQEHLLLLNEKTPLSDDDFLSILFDY